MGGSVDDSLLRLRRFLRTGLEGSRYQAGGVGAAGAKFSSESAPTLHALVEGTMAAVVLQELLRLVDNTDENSPRQAACPEAIAPEVCDQGSRKSVYPDADTYEEVSEGTGWGRAHRRAVSRWYTATEGSGARQLAAQTTRVVRRHRWTHADLLRLAHVRPPQHRPGVAVVLRYLARGLPAAAKMVEEKEAEGGSVEEAWEALAYLQAVHEVRHTKDEQVAARLLEEHQLALEHVPSHLLRSKEVWLCLVRRLPLDELVAHVPRLSRGGLLARGPLVGALRERLRSASEQSPPRLGPLETYALKRSLEAGRPKHHHHHHHRSSSHQLDDVVAALHEHSFKAVSPTGKRYLVAVDVRGPMTHGRTRGLDGLTPAEVSALMLQALTPMGAVDVSLPLRWAREQKHLFDLVLVCTDNQTQSWSIHPAQALKEYRESCSLPDTRFIVCAMCSQGFSLAPPDELGMLDMAGCDSHTLQLIQDFAKGDF
ncbi:hypothetical protein HPB52_018861 [Rhipicephalus sanguineus]|uniref:TROVE domain-containing protein n=1 Tax=Rhipicephalus sanguineus TaxID=34632 RepID=A0A9D4PNW7_RHISA|nr:hypothetical protein HPB52_018861 [Rhipicephalus sanguineus]